MARNIELLEECLKRFQNKKEPTNHDAREIRLLSAEIRENVDLLLKARLQTKESPLGRSLVLMTLLSSLSQEGHVSPDVLPMLFENVPGKDLELLAGKLQEMSRRKPKGSSQR